MLKLSMKFHAGYIFFIITMLFFSGCNISVSQNEKVEFVEASPEEQSETLESVKVFLNKIDQSNYDTWDDLASILKNTTSETEWKLLLKTMRKTSGKVIERKFKGLGCTEKLPGAPKGRYFIIDFNTRFERFEITERLVTSLEDNKWKIAGYHMNKTIKFKDKKS